MLSLALSILGTLALTLAVELPVAVALGLRGRPGILAVVCVNLVTNPCLNLLAGLIWSSAPSAYVPAVALLEVAVVLMEWRLLLWSLGGRPRRLLLVTVAMNAASVAVGLIALVV